MLISKGHEADDFGVDGRNDGRSNANRAPVCGSGGVTLGALLTDARCGPHCNLPTPFAS
jgi:hypothetical protein